MKAVLEAKSELDDAIRIRVCQQEVIDSLKADFAGKLNDAAPRLERALSLVTDADDKQEVRRARLHSAYANFWLRKNYEAAVLAADVARNAAASDGTLAHDCTCLAFAALVQAFSQSPVGRREDLQLIINACNKLTDRWPTSDRAIESVMILGKLHSAQQLPADAAIWFGKVAPSHPMYPEAQINAGQAYWNAYVKASHLAVPQKPEPAQFSAWLIAAHGHLRSGIDAMTKRVPDDETPPERLRENGELESYQRMKKSVEQLQRKLAPTEN